MCAWPFVAGSESVLALRHRRFLFGCSSAERKMTHRYLQEHLCSISWLVSARFSCLRLFSVSHQFRIHCSGMKTYTCTSPWGRTIALRGRCCAWSDHSRLLSPRLWTELRFQDCTALWLSPGASFPWKVRTHPEMVNSTNKWNKFWHLAVANSRNNTAMKRRRLKDTETQSNLSFFVAYFQQHKLQFNL